MHRNSVEVFQRDGRWIVRVTEHGVSLEEHFGLQESAKSWAAGQIIRLRRQASPDAIADCTGVEHLFSRASQLTKTACDSTREALLNK